MKAGKRPPQLSADERERRRGGISPLDRLGSPYSSEPRSVGARLSNWNDRHSSHDRRVEASLRYRCLDRLASWLYVRGW